MAQVKLLIGQSLRRLNATKNKFANRRNLFPDNSLFHRGLPWLDESFRADKTHVAADCFAKLI